MGFHISLMNLRQTRQPYQGIPPRQPGRHRQKPRLASPLRRIGQPYRNYPSRRAAHRLPPLAVMPSGPMIFCLDNSDNIHGILDSLILHYCGRNVWKSFEKVLNGDEMNKQE